MKLSTGVALPYYAWLLLGGILPTTLHPAVATDSYTTTSYAQVLTQARGKIPNADGPVKAKVSAQLQLSLLFNLLAGTGYVAGNVTATTDKRGHVVQLVKGKQTCKVSYNVTTRSFKNVNCSTRPRRALGGDIGSNDPDPDDEADGDGPEADGGVAGWDGQLPLRRRRLGPICGSCVSLATSAFKNRTTPICQTRFARAVPAAYGWAKAAAAAICALRARLVPPLKYAYTTCRCPCSYMSPADCPSLVCSMYTSFCMAEKLGIGAYCERSFDCVNKLCAISKWQSPFRVCCPSNRSIAEWWGSYCFASSELGEGCRSDDYCKSQLCVNYKCAAQRLGGGETCYDHDDCENQRCYASKYPTDGSDKTCCLTNASSFGYCTEISSVGDRCGDNSMCKVGICSDGFCLAEKLEVGQQCFGGDDADCVNGVCGQILTNGGDSYLCCPSNASSFGWCTDTAELGDECRVNKACKSGVCSNYTCIAQRHGIGEPCPDGDDDDCQNGACGRPTYSDAAYVCCPSNSSTQSMIDLWDYCDAIQGLGDRCDNNQQCISGVCSNRTCIAQRIATGQPCPDGENDDCQNGACGRARFPGGAYVCCPSNNQTGPFWGSYCTATQALGDSCETNSQCVSGVCSAWKCIAGRIETGQPCPGGDNDDCQNGACGLASYPDGAYVCCPSNRRTLAYATLEGYVYLQSYCDSTQGIGMPCNTTELCVGGGSGVACSAGVCRSV